MRLASFYLFVQYYKKMHGQGRAEYKARQRDEIVTATLSQKARQWHSLTSELMSQRLLTDDSPSTTSLQDHLRLSDKLLSVNPDPIYLWNCRRDTVLQILHSSESTPTQFIQNEQALTTTCLKRNPKAYGAWFHRKWCIREYVLLEIKMHISECKMTESLSGACSRTDLLQRMLSTLNQELDLCSEFLRHDERNFHCWNYRRFIVSISATILALINSNASTAGLWTSESRILNLLHEKLDGSWWWRSSNIISVPGPQISPNDVNADEELSTVTLNLALQDEANIIEKEWKFTDEKITLNFSNGSAFHYRSILLQYVLEIQIPVEFSSLQSTTNDKMAQRNTKKLQLLLNELDIVHNAIFTEPDDQTIWWYYRFLIKWATPNAQHEVLDDSYHLHMTAALETFRETLQNECLVIKDLIEAENNKCKWGHLTLHFILKTLISIEHKNEEKCREWTIDAENCLHHLIDNDVDRIHRYESLL